MARFHKLTVTDIHKTIRDAVVVTLTPDDPESFDFTQGQYLTFRRDFDGQELRRSYSICAGKDDGILQVGIKRVDGGAFSTWANEELAMGDTIEAMPPMGNFHTAIEPGSAKSYLGFAGGSGITPVLSIIKTTLAREPLSDFTLVYANKSATTIMFREEIEDLKNRYMGRFTVIHVLEADTQEIDLFTGLVNEEKCALLFKQWINIKSIDTAFICGPEPMMLGIAKSLREHGLTDSQIKFELFASAQPGRAAKKAVSKGASSGTGTEAVINLDGSSRTITMDADTSILDAALAENMDAPYACKAGVCSTCRCKVLEGDVDMIANHALEDYEVEKGYVLSCQAYAKSDKVIVDFDQ
ncbi:2Fe-2S iron-sulfur cluster binding domain-containing protein [Aliiroseovarius crassostreae]|uniref:2Fe-2S iron-sulfur cluster binding domain-containing protein n=1 Tax=Aliiroseovarius crassostreae TaxID=154981 RepID=A0A9Q9HAV3_9RHOB|nr:2Fe-2S iron-sulfur cluster-binding protein [Aliiroseovarius crassostreae]UWP96728.1 2Fe-2S iron-sulfur cluster binding domain-containing protein [Aliiroseovarius crassostreae]